MADMAALSVLELSRNFFLRTRLSAGVIMS